MDTIKSIIITLLALFLCRDLYSSSQEGRSLCGENDPYINSSPSWETGADLDITGRFVVSSILHGSSFRMNMLCSAETMKDFKIMRCSMRRILESELCPVISLTAAETLMAMAGADISGITKAEKRAIAFSSQNRTGGNMFRPGSFAESCPVREINDCINMPALATSRTKTVKRIVSRRNNHFRKICDYSSLIQRENEKGHADYYRLYLYVKDHTGMGDHCGISTFPFPFRFQLHPVITEYIKENFSIRLQIHRSPCFAGRHRFSSHRLLSAAPPDLMVGVAGYLYIAIKARQASCQAGIILNYGGAV